MCVCVRVCAYSTFVAGTWGLSRATLSGYMHIMFAIIDYMRIYLGFVDSSSSTSATGFHMCHSGFVLNPFVFWLQHTGIEHAEHAASSCQNWSMLLYRTDPGSSWRFMMVKVWRYMSRAMGQLWDRYGWSKSKQTTGWCETHFWE